MGFESFENEIAELLEVDSVAGSDPLEEFESWDSLTSLSIIAYIDEKFQVSVSAKDLTDAKTIEGLKNLVLMKTKSK